VFEPESAFDRALTAASKSPRNSNNQRSRIASGKLQRNAVERWLLLELVLALLLWWLLLFLGSASHAFMRARNGRHRMRPSSVATPAADKVATKAARTVRPS
jgi:hypothetical protein